MGEPPAVEPPAVCATLGLAGGAEARVLVLGARCGPALADWAARLPRASIVGLYADASAAPRAAPRTAVVQATPSPEIAEQLGDFDVVIDDGSLAPLARVQALRAFGPGAVRGGGAYVAAPLPAAGPDWLADAMREAAEDAGGTLGALPGGELLVT